MGQLETKFINPEAVTDDRQSPMPADTIKGNNTGASAVPSNLTVAQVRALLNLSEKSQVFLANGTFTIPADTLPTTRFKFTIIAGGGSGGAGDASGAGGGGGGGGNTAIKYLTGLTPGATILVTVGQGGVGVGSAQNGNPGTLSKIESGTQAITTVTALPGQGGRGGAGVRAWRGGNGGKSINADFYCDGQGGGYGDVIAYPGQGGNGIGGVGGNSFLCGGSRGGWDVNGEENGDAVSGFGAGSGGGGARAGAVNGTSQNAGPGLVVVEWI